MPIRDFHFVERSRLVVWLLFAALVTGCCGQPGQPSCNNPQITVTPISSGLSVSGSQFSGGATPCVHLGIVGLPTTTGSSGSISLGDAACPSGSFNHFEWHYSYFNCTPSTTINVNVVATDQKTLKAAIQPATLPWGPQCGLVNYTSCGGQGEIPCAGLRCSEGPPTLHPDLQGGIVVCNANCGHTQGYSPCIAGMDGCPISGGSTLIAPQRACVVPESGKNVFSCFNHSRLSNSADCLCLPNSQNACTTNTSKPTPPAPISGTCTSAAFEGC